MVGASDISTPVSKYRSGMKKLKNNKIAYLRNGIHGATFCRMHHPTRMTLSVKLWFQTHHHVGFFSTVHDEQHKPTHYIRQRRRLNIHLRLTVSNVAEERTDFFNKIFMIYRKWYRVKSSAYSECFGSTSSYRNLPVSLSVNSIMKGLWIAIHESFGRGLSWYKEQLWKQYVFSSAQPKLDWSRLLKLRCEDLCCFFFIIDLPNGGPTYRGKCPRHQTPQGQQVIELKTLPVDYPNWNCEPETREFYGRKKPNPVLLSCSLLFYPALGNYFQKHNIMTHDSWLLSPSKFSSTHVMNISYENNI